ncbi:MAG: hypothetical protein KA715_11145 [Xanthomonadaceae bacterium]|nr:hypothetical protein [Xanthomonadaceae bacterium]
MNFSLDELVRAVSEVTKTGGIPGIVSLILQAVDESICKQWVEGLTEEKFCCKEPRRIHSSAGVLRFSWTRLKCKICKHSFIPLKQFFNIKPYSGHTLEFEQIGCETVSHQSYRRAAHHIKQVGGVSMNKSKLHSWVMKTKSPNLKLKQKNLVTIIADGTGYPRFKTREEKEAERQNPKRESENRPLEQLRVILGINKESKTIPNEVFNEYSWAQFGRMARKANQHEKLLPKPIAEVLVSDGERALERGLGKLAKTH